MTVPTPHLVRLFGGVRALVIGDLILDEYVSGGCDRVSPEAPVPVLQVTQTRSVLGGAANAAANITSLGGSCTLMGLLGIDDAAQRFRELCASHRIALTAHGDGRPTTRKVRVVGERQQLVRLDYEKTGPAGAEAAAALIREVEAALKSAHVLVVSDYAKGTLSAELCQAAFGAARAAGVPVIVDPRPQHRALYQGCDVTTPNWKEALGLLGEPEQAPSDAAVESVGRRLIAELGCTVVLTLGARGLRVFPRDGAEAFSVSATAREVFDVSGAGDTVVATLALALGAGASLRESVELANRAAGIVVGKLGTATVTADELLGVADDSRLVARGDLAAVADALRANRRRIVTINGSFDVLHAGHLYILEEARRQGDVLIVGLNSDASVRAYKGPTRPVVGQEDRARLLLGLRCVDYVHMFDETDPIAFLEAVRPDVHVNGAEYGEECIEAPTVKKHGGRLHLVGRVKGLSTSGLVARIGEDGRTG
jgi:D-beta-D-heptose 7-phosphate kinase/D-beta-D-heptose 1-phosphate adenosyltransferase